MSLKQEQLKKIIKPLIKECLTEILMEQGLKKVIEEAVAQPPHIQKQVEQPLYEQKEKQFLKNNLPNQKDTLLEKRKELAQKIGMSGFDPFKGTMPIDSGDNSQGFENLVPEVQTMPGISGRGVDISGLLGNSKAILAAALGSKKKE